MIGFFHQNDVFGRQGGIERYLATLAGGAAGGAALVSAPLSGGSPNHFSITAIGSRKLPEWSRYLLGVFRQRRALSAFLRDRDVKVLEFSRPEYVLFAWLFSGRRVFTIHGTGPNKSDRLHYLIHHLCCCLLPLFAARIQIVGRDRSGLSRIAQRLLRGRIAHVDAWFDDRFRPLEPAPIEGEPFRVFYAGRVASQKNPELLFSIIRSASSSSGVPFEFHYFGSDYAKFADAGLSALVRDHGFLGPSELAQAIGSCHVGLLCSGFGEGSPFIVVEALACGRPFVLPPLPTLVDAYSGIAGVEIVERYDAQAFIDALMAVRADLLASRLDPHVVAAQVADRSQTRATRALLENLAELGR